MFLLFYFLPFLWKHFPDQLGKFILSPLKNLHDRDPSHKKIFESNMKTFSYTICNYSLLKYPFFILKSEIRKNFEFFNRTGVFKKKLGTTNPLQ